MQEVYRFLETFQILIKEGNPQPNFFVLDQGLQKTYHFKVLQPFVNLLM